MTWTHKARMPRKHKKATRKVYGPLGLKALSPNELHRYRQCHFVRGSRPRKVGAHVAMGDTSTINARLRRERAEADRG